MDSSLQQIVSMTTLKPHVDARLQVLEFSPLNADGYNFLEWANDASIALGAQELIIYLNRETAECIPEVLKFQTILLL